MFLSFFTINATEPPPSRFTAVLHPSFNNSCCESYRDNPFSSETIYSGVEF